MDKNKILNAIDRFQELKVLIIGDVILDAYYRGSVNRISPEAPVSVLDISSKEYRLGGAANVALNIKGLGATPLLCSVVGSDEAGNRTLNLLSNEGLNTSGVRSSADRISSVKTRLMSNNHQLMRMDEEQTNPIEANDEIALLERITNLVNSEHPHVIIFEDYDKGTITPTVIGKVIELSRAKGIPTAVDPKKRNFLSYSGVTLFKPNLRELRDGLNQQDLKATASDLEQAFRFLNDIMPIEMAFFTLSSDGVYITNGNENHHAPAHKRNISDVSGAGDTVISTAACGLATGLAMDEIAYLSNLAGGWVCQFPGVVAIDAKSLKQEFSNITT
ncbi:MAG: bifunctional ADP-heptose synthase [Flavobacteriales bacterium]